MKILFWILGFTILWLLLGVLGFIWSIKLDNIGIEDINYLKENTSVILFGGLSIIVCLYYYLEKHWINCWKVWLDKKTQYFVNGLLKR